MSRRAWLYILTIMFLGLLVGIQATLIPLRTSQEFWTFAVLVILATIAQVYRAEGQKVNISFFATPVFFFAGVLLLEPATVALLVLIPHLVEWVVVRFVRGDKVHLRAWYIQPFNIAMYILAARAAQYAHTLLMNELLLVTPGGNALTSIFAAIVYLVVNQAILGQVLVLARNISWKESEVLRIENLFPEFIMLCLGIVIAQLWKIDGWLIIPALTPLVLMYRALQIPQLMKAAQVDSKTGLYNAGHFQQRFEEEFERAKRFDRPMTVIMADLDLLRNINNTYGHLAGDVVLEGIGRIIRNSVREYDIAGRFGGEEFSLVLPETEQLAALEVAERIRREVEAAEFRVPSSPTPVKATISIGIAIFPQDGDTIQELVHEADIAVYQAKYQGRNRVIYAGDVPHSVKLERDSIESQEQPEYALVAGAGAVVVQVSEAASAAMPADGATTRPESPPATVVKASALPSQQPASAPAPKVQRVQSEHVPPARSHTQFTERLMNLFVGLVIVAGMLLAALFSQAAVENPLAILMLVGLAIVAEWMQINVYGEHSMSVSMAMVFSAALITGMPGVCIVSAAIVVTNHVRRQRGVGEWYKTLFNWSVHVIAALVPLSMSMLMHDRLALPMLLTLLGLAILAAFGYYIIETGLISLAISLSRSERIISVWRAQFRWLATHYVVLGVSGLFLSIAYLALGLSGIVVFALPILMQRYAQQQYVARTNANVLELRRMNTELAQANREVTNASQSIQSLNQRLRNVNTELYRTVGQILDARDPYVAGHSAQVAHYAAAIARELGLPADHVEMIYHAGLMHDIGKIAIPEQILHKPARLTLQEFEQMKFHTTIGAELLLASPALSHLAPLIRHHHERWDGTGYPDGLQGDQIPLEARILAVCDTVEAMASDRPYRAADSFEAIVAELQRCSGTQFEPQIVDAFVRVVERHADNFVVNSARAVQQRTGREISGPPATSLSVASGKLTG